MTRRINDAAVLTRIAHGLATVLLTLAGITGGRDAQAGVVLLDADFNAVTVGAEVSDSRYRISNTNWEQAISTSSLYGPTTIVQNRNLGNHNQLDEATFGFTMTYTSGVGYSFRLQHVSGGAPAVTDWTVQWTAPHTNGDSQLRPFNAIQVYVQAGSGMPGNIAAAHVTTDIDSFTATGYTNVGTLRDLQDLWDDEPPLDDRQDPGIDRQLLVANGDLSLTDWTLTGRVTAGFDYIVNNGNPGGNIDERLKFDILTLSVDPGSLQFEIPEPASLPLLMIGAAMLMVRPRRHERPRH